MTSKRQLAVEDHLALAAHVLTLRKAEMEIFQATVNLPKTGAISRARRRLASALLQLQCDLDTAWHEVASDEVFEAHGHVYFRE